MLGVQLGQVPEDVLAGDGPEGGGVDGVGVGAHLVRDLRVERGAHEAVGGARVEGEDLAGRGGH